MSYPANILHYRHSVDRVGFEPTKPEARDLQSPVIDQLYDLSKKRLSPVSYNKLNNLVVERGMLPYPLAMSFLQLA